MESYAKRNVWEEERGGGAAGKPATTRRELNVQLNPLYSPNNAAGVSASIEPTGALTSLGIVIQQNGGGGGGEDVEGGLREGGRAGWGAVTTTAAAAGINILPHSEVRIAEKTPSTKSVISTALDLPRGHPSIPTSSIPQSSCPFSSSAINPQTPSPPPPTTTSSSEPLPPAFSPLPSYPPNHHLQTSPYPSQTHLLPLLTLPAPHRLLALALTVLTNTVPTYATTPYRHAFNWPVVVSTLRALHLHLQQPPPGEEGPPRNSTTPTTTNNPFPHTESYIIVFRSQLLPSSSNPRLHDLDILAHEEANLSGGLLKYWFGTPDAERRNLATCVWRDIRDAKCGGSGKGHREAMREVHGQYREWVVERLRFVVYEGAERWDIVPW